MTASEVRAALARLGMTQAQAAQALGVDPRTVRGWIATPQRSRVPAPAALAIRMMMEACDG